MTAEATFQTNIPFSGVISNNIKQVNNAEKLQ